MGGSCADACAAVDKTCDTALARAEMHRIDEQAEFDAITASLAFGTELGTNCTNYPALVNSKYPLYRPLIGFCGLPAKNPDGEFIHACSSTEAGHYRVCFCHHVAPPQPPATPPPATPPTPPPPVAPSSGIAQCFNFTTEEEAHGWCHAYSLDASNTGACRVRDGGCNTTDATSTAGRRLSEPATPATPSQWIASLPNEDCFTTCDVRATASNRPGLVCEDYAEVTDAPWYELQDSESEAAAIFAATPGFAPCTHVFATNEFSPPYQVTAGAAENFCYFSTAVGSAAADCTYARWNRRILCWCETDAPPPPPEFAVDVFDTTPSPPTSPPVRPPAPPPPVSPAVANFTTCFNASDVTEAHRFCHEFNQDLSNHGECRVDEEVCGADDPTGDAVDAAVLNGVLNSTAPTASVTIFMFGSPPPSSPPLVPQPSPPPFP